MTKLALLLFLAAVGHGLSLRSGVPVIPVLLGLGMVLSFIGGMDGADGILAASDDPVFFVLEFGLTVLVFASGLELSPQRFRRQWSAAWRVGVVQFSVMGVAGWLVARWLGYDGLPAVYLALAVSASSTVVVLRLLQQRQQAVEPHGRMVMGVLLLQDAMTLLALVALMHLGRGLTVSWFQYGLALGMVGAAWWLQRRGGRWLLERCRGDEEALLLSVLSVLFVFLGGASMAGLPLVGGAFLAGYSLSGFPVSGQAGSLLQSMSDFFRAIFFVALGALVAVPGAEALGAAVVLGLLVLVATPPLVAWVAEKSGMTSRAAIDSGLLLAQTSEYSLMLGLLGLRFGHIGPQVFTVIVLMAVLTMSGTPLLAGDAVARWLMRLHPSYRRRLPSLEHRDHVLVLGFGSAGTWVLRPLVAAGLPVLVVDDDPAVIAELDRQGIAGVRGDGSDAHTLERVGAREARFIIASMRRVADARQVLDYVRGVPVLVRVFEDDEAEAVRQAGGIPVSSAEAATEQFLQWWAAGGHSHHGDPVPPARPR